MKFKNLYEITFQTKRGSWTRHLIHLEAFNAKEAKELAKELWYGAYAHHMFNIETRRIPEDESIDMKHWFIKA